MYTPNPINTDDITLSEDLLALTEQIATNVHDVWAAGRIKEGWTYGEIKNTEEKTTSCLVPYDELPESEKELAQAIDKITADTYNIKSGARPAITAVSKFIDSKLLSHFSRRTKTYRLNQN